MSEKEEARGAKGEGGWAPLEGGVEKGKEQRLDMQQRVKASRGLEQNELG